MSIDSTEYERITRKQASIERRQPSAAVERVIMQAQMEATAVALGYSKFEPNEAGRNHFRQIAERAQARIKELQEGEQAK